MGAVAMLEGETVAEAAVNSAVSKPDHKATISAKFGRGQWTPDDWIMMRRPDTDNEAPWVQHDDCISNEKAISPETQAKPVTERKSTEISAHNSMVHRQKVSGNFSAKATMLFEDKQAPSIMLAGKLGQDAQGRMQYVEHVEVVIYYQGINVWKHQFKNGKSNWTKLMYARFPLEKAKPYTLEVTRKGAEIRISVDGHSCGYFDDSLTNALFLGVTADEGVNRIYDFAVQQSP
jgi:hypothetical protein